MRDVQCRSVIRRMSNKPYVSIEETSRSATNFVGGEGAYRAYWYDSFFGKGTLVSV